MAKYLVRRRELLDYQARIQNEGEPTNSEAVECWRKYYEVLMLSGLLQIWETLQLRAEGPCFPRVLRRTKGPRMDGGTITHIVSEKLTPSMLRSFPDDAVLQQHKTPATAIQQCYEGDLILIYPGVYEGEGFHELTESITIRGEGDRDEIVIEAIYYNDLFVNISCGDVTIENITLDQKYNTEGILRVESGHARVVNCLLRCDGTGVTVREGARITMTGCSITGAK
uniref:Right handed beta helix domain-containing protein n=1 Tax=Ciona savignyi TaxID=51511 RepID=H2YX36_CIOSA